jgi:hypothetical protein
MWVREAKEAERKVLTAKAHLYLEDLHELEAILPEYEYELIEQHLNPEAYENLIMPWETNKVTHNDSDLPWNT